MHRALKAMIRDLENIFEVSLKPIAKYQHSWYRRRGLTRGYEKAWIFIDRPMFADDNAEHLFRYVKNQHPEINSFYALNKDSKDWVRLEHEGFNLIPIGDPEWKAALLEAQVVLSSHMSLASTNPLPFYFNRYASRKFVFLRHGIGISNRHTWLNRRNVDLMVVSTPWEYEELVKKDTFKFTEIDVKATGLARYDELFIAAETHQKVLNTVLIMPTWRKEFVRFIGIKKGARSIDADAFKNSKFFLEWGNFLNSPKLEQLAQDHGIRFRLLLHPNLVLLLDYLHIPEHFELHETTGDTFQEAILKSKLLITDYTSVAFDMAYINRPTLYLQFDKDDFLQIEKDKVRNLDYKYEGFGPVADNSNELISNLSEYLINGIDPVYEQRMKEFFFYKDANSRKRIIDEVLKRVVS
jgi:CDP-glycerol glycerophosphotransferase (TagB/SpsB family)